MIKNGDDGWQHGTTTRLLSVSLIRRVWFKKEKQQKVLSFFRICFEASHPKKRKASCITEVQQISTWNKQQPPQTSLSIASWSWVRDSPGTDVSTRSSTVLICCFFFFAGAPLSFLLLLSLAFFASPSLLFESFFWSFGSGDCRKGTYTWS